MNTPDYLNDRAKAAYKKATEVLDRKGLINDADYTLLEMYAVLYDRWRHCEEMIAKEGLIKSSPNGFPMIGDHVNIANNTQKQLITILRELGCSPKSRKALMTADKDAVQKQDIEKWAKLKKPAA